MCQKGRTTPIRLSDGLNYSYRTIYVDSCIAPVIQALNVGGVRTTGSCCGHGEGPGMIALEDGRMVLVVDWPQDRKVLQDLKNALPWPIL